MQRTLVGETRLHQTTPIMSTGGWLFCYVLYIDLKRDVKGTLSWLSDHRDDQGSVYKKAHEHEKG